METSNVLFALLRAVVCNQPVPEDIKAACTDEMVEQVHALAAKHDLAHLAGQALSKLNLPENDGLAKCQLAAKQAIFRYMRLDLAYTQICDTLEKAEIPFIPLKGSVLRAYYPEPWMRTSCDIDILVKEEMLDTAVAVLTKELNYKADPKTDHDISLYTPDGVHLELHYDTIQERYEVGGCRNVLAGIWENASPIAPGSYQMILSDAMFYFYHIAHMAKHFEVGGCGIRAFLDIWILQHRVECDPAQRELLLKEGGLLKFAQGAEQVAAWWFADAEPDEMTRQISDYILRAGLYGDNANRAALGHAKMGSRLKYLLLRRVFMPYDYLKAEYPVLQKQRWLTPVFQVVRWCRMVVSGGANQTLQELRANTRTSQEATAYMKKMLSHLGFK